MLLILCIEEANDGQWSIDEVTEKLRQSGGDNWKVVFKEVVNLEEKIFEENVCDKTPEEYVDYAARHDLTFLTPSGHQIRFKVNFIGVFHAVAKINVQARRDLNPHLCNTGAAL